MNNIVVMGVSGSGKSTVGLLLAERLGVPFGEADEFHSPENIAKMSSGTPLDDTDRNGWLDAMTQWLHTHQDSGCVLACSALKIGYRDRLRTAVPQVFFAHLVIDEETSKARVT